MTYQPTCGITEASQERRQVVPPKGGDNMSAIEIIDLLNLIAVVVLGILSITKQK